MIGLAVLATRPIPPTPLEAGRLLMEAGLYEVVPGAGVRGVVDEADVKAGKVKITGNPAKFADLMGCLVDLDRFFLFDVGPRAVSFSHENL